jgi:hypothetical protein
VSTPPRFGNSAIAQQIGQLESRLQSRAGASTKARVAVNEGILKAVWWVRRWYWPGVCQPMGGSYIQGCLLNWRRFGERGCGHCGFAAKRGVEPWRRSRLGRRSAKADAGDRAGAAGARPGARAAITVVSPIRISLLITWACVLVAAGAIGMLLTGAMSLERAAGRIRVGGHA